MTWTCPGCGEIYLQHECVTCHMKGEDLWLRPVDVAVDGVHYVVQRMTMGGLVVVDTLGMAAPPLVRSRVIREFLAQQHS